MNPLLAILRGALPLALLLGPSWCAADGPPDGLIGNPPPPSAGTLYSVDHATGNLVTIDPNTAAVNPVGPTGFNFVEALTYHSPTDTLLGFDNDSNQLISINRETGAGVAVGPTGYDFLFGMTYSESDDTLFAVDSQTNDLVTVDPSTGSTALFFSLGFDNVGGLTDDPATGVLYGADFGLDQVFLASFEGGIGLVAPIVDVVPSSMQGLAFDPTTSDLFALSIQVGPEALLRIDPLTDSVSVVGALESFSGASLAFVPTSVPEPAAAALLGLATLIAPRRRR